ncbi:MAG TPA: hypothetical protein VIJ92_16945 [Ginsengibacter sp.]
MRIKNLLILVVVLFVISCKKNSTGGVTPQQQDTYLTTSAGSTWNYHEVDSSGSTPVNKDYVLISSSKDTVVNTRSYHVFNVSTGGSQYLTLSGNDYYQYDSLPAGSGNSDFEQLYLKDNVNVGTSWSQSSNVTIQGVTVPITLTYKISQKGISRTVNSINYNNVTVVSTTISSALIPAASLTSSINSYYAPKYGLIENATLINLNYGGITENVNTEIKLASATLL